MKKKLKSTALSLLSALSIAMILPSCIMIIQQSDNLPTKKKAKVIRSTSSCDNNKTCNNK